ncbi:uncharacterized protein LOC133736985 isoform X3 [Rosa rugosa]|uniref:uncharacterized protein LOC133736985 isoform X3 n=1 Tax=Rosa rugosa TaxID=74645 RepID=UPI002B414C52|nr:uncharacterized protein LOC133736985 isoform X3 [Rosa rugosa]
MESEFCNSGWVLWIHQEKPKSWYLIQELLFPRQHSGENGHARSKRLASLASSLAVVNYQLEHGLGFALLPSQIGGVQQLLLRGKWSNTLYALFWSYFAAIRGVNPVVQPLIDLNMNVLVYNGEIFGGIEIASEENDGEVLMGLLGGCESCVSNVVSRIKGPWAIIYWLVTFEWLVCEDITYWGSRGYCHSS